MKRKILRLLLINIAFVLIGTNALSQTNINTKAIQNQLYQIDVFASRAAFINSLEKSKPEEAESARLDLVSEQEDSFPVMRQRFARNISPVFEACYVLEEENDVLNVYSKNFDMEGGYQQFLNTFRAHLEKFRFSYVMLSGKAQTAEFRLPTLPDSFLIE